MAEVTYFAVVRVIWVFLKQRFAFQLAIRIKIKSG